jgi:molybdenum cofactor cytidylyltransferase
MSWKQPTAGIILAAGESTRFGQPKQLAKLKDKYLLEWILDAALESQLKLTILVLGFRHQTILQAVEGKIQHPRLEVVVNKRYQEGQSLSLLAGLCQCRHKFPSTMFLLGDQPMVDRETINALLDNFWSSPKDICVPVYRGRRGNPVIFSNRFYHQIMALKGDVGARKIIQSNPDHVLQVQIDNPQMHFDIDTPEDLALLETFIS